MHISFLILITFIFYHNCSWLFICFNLKILGLACYQVDKMLGGRKVLSVNCYWNTINISWTCCIFSDHRRRGAAQSTLVSCTSSLCACAVPPCFGRLQQLICNRTCKQQKYTLHPRDLNDLGLPWMLIAEKLTFVPCLAFFCRCKSFIFNGSLKAFHLLST